MCTFCTDAAHTVCRRAEGVYRTASKLPQDTVPYLSPAWRVKHGKTNGLGHVAGVQGFQECTVHFRVSFFEYERKIHG